MDRRFGYYISKTRHVVPANFSEHGYSEYYARGSWTQPTHLDDTDHWLSFRRKVPDLALKLLSIPLLTNPKK